MSTRDIEQGHLIDLKKILEEEGIECIRVMVDLAESKSSIGDEQITVDEQEQIKEELREVCSPEEEPALVEETAEETVPYVFPTPSLRKVLPEDIREIEKFNTIHVLPEKFNYSIDPSAIPRIYGTPKQSYIDALADLVGCTRYKNSLAEYWFLDTLADLLRRAQDDYMDRSSQAVLIVWFCEWMKEIQYFDAANRERMLKRFKENMLAAAKFVDAKERLPLPHEVGVSHEPISEEHQAFPPGDAAASNSKLTMVTLQGLSYECCLRDLIDIVHYIYDLFSTDYQFDLVQSVFTFPPDYTVVDAPYTINQPKRMYEPKASKKEAAKSNGKNNGKNNGKKRDKNDGKGNGSKEGSHNQIVTTAGDVAGHLLELQMREQKELQDIEEREREERLKKNSILPLSMAVDDDFFQKYLF